MKKLFYSLLVLTLTVCTSFGQSPNAPAVLFRSGAVTLPANAASFDQKEVMAETEVVGDRFFRLIQFNQIPSAAQHRELARAGFRLLDYIPHNVYVADMPTSVHSQQLLALGIRSITPITPHLKMADNLRERPFPEWAIRKDKVAAVLKYYASIPHDDALSWLQAAGADIISHNGFNNFVHVALDPEQMEAVSRLPFVAYLELAPEPGEPEDVPGRGLHRANMIDTQFPSGRHYTGEEVKVLVRDDGFVGPHIDFQGRISQDVANDGTIQHADGVAGIFAGAGNRDPRVRGMAAGAFIYVLDYQANFLDNTLPLHVDADVLVTNSSYSNGCNTGYTINAATVDQQLFQFPTFMHVFSAGNSNNSDCNYGAGNQWGNITGGHKQSKNSIATANLFGNAALVNSSSRGPAYDGRIKPDISAHGNGQLSTDPNHQYSAFSGTSAAAPGIAGITAQLHQAYRETYPGTLADAALLKAILLNTANDLGNPGPDFKFGWGHVNAYRAALAIEEGRFFSATIENGQLQTHDIIIPDGVRQAKIMIYWSDKEASELAAKSLVANLDALLAGPGGTHQPWVLNITPDPALLDLPATTGTDTLNNMEQIALIDPAAGTYTLAIGGAEVPFPGQKYWVTWEFVSNDITLTYPAGGEGLAPGDVERIHWDAFGNNGDITIEYSTNNGASWTAPAIVGGGTRMYEWTVPDQPSGQAFIRLTQNGVSVQNTVPFSIAAPPANLQIAQACPDFIRLTWDAAPAATAYDVFLLGQQYMDSIGTTTELFFDVPAIDLNPSLDHWVSVRAVGDDGLRSRRAVAIPWNQGLKDCPLEDDLAIVQIVSPGSALTACGSADAPVTVRIWNNGQSPQIGATASFQADNEPSVTEIIPSTIEIGDTILYTFATPLTLSGPGMVNLKTWASVGSGVDQAAFNDTLANLVNAVIYPGAGAAIGLTEDFEGTVIPPDFWQIINPDGAFTFEPRECTGPDGQTTIAMRINNFAYNATGQEDALVTLPFDLSDANENTLLTFDLAYAVYNLSQYWDALRIDVYTDCGATFAETIYYKEKDALATIPPLTQPFTPNNANQWRKEAVNLGQFAGQSIVVHFVNITGYGNNLHIDNVNVDNYIAPTASMSVSDTIACQGGFVDFLDNSQGENLSYQWNFGTGSFPSTANGPGPHNILYVSAGIKNARLIVYNGVLADTTFQTIEVNPTPVANFAFSVANGTVSFNNLSQHGLSYSWNFGDGNTSNMDNPVHSYQSTGDYLVTLTVINDCGEKVSAKTIQVVISSLNEPGADQTVRILPNPNNGIFEILLDGAADMRITDATGREVWSGFSASPLPVDLSDYAKGVYWLQVRTEGAVKTFKIILQ